MMGLKLMGVSNIRWIHSLKQLFSCSKVSKLNSNSGWSNRPPVADRNCRVTRLIEKSVKPAGQDLLHYRGVAIGCCKVQGISVIIISTIRSIEVWSEQFQCPVASSFILLLYQNIATYIMCAEAHQHLSILQHTLCLYWQK